MYSTSFRVEGSSSATRMVFEKAMSGGVGASDLPVASEVE
jgi:hypothetical protein